MKTENNNPNTNGKTEELDSQGIQNVNGGTSIAAGQLRLSGMMADLRNAMNGTDQGSGGNAGPESYYPGAGTATGMNVSTDGNTQMNPVA